MKKDSDYEITLIAQFFGFYMVVACFYYLAYFAGSHSWFSNQHDLCFIVKDMQETGWVGFSFILAIYILSPLILSPIALYEYFCVKKKSFSLLVISVISIFSIIPLTNMYKYGVMNNETECFVKYGAEFENLVEEDNGILSLIAYRNIAPNGNEIDRVMGLADKQLIEKFKDYKSLKGSFKHYVLQEYADSYFRDRVVLEVDYKFRNYMKNLISEVYEQQLNYEESLKVFKVDKIARDRYKANIENAQKTVIRIQEEEDFKNLEAERIKHRF